MKKTILLARTFGAVLIALSLLTPSAFAQTATTATTLSTAIADSATTTVVVASATNVDAGGMLYVDREALDVISVNSTTVRVRRGSLGTRAASHVINTVVYVAAKAQKAGVFTTWRSGSCTAAAQGFLPQIDASSGGIYDCPSAVGQWVNLRNQVIVTCRALLIADMIDQSCFTADRAYLLVKITEVHTTAESGGTLTLIPKRQVGTQAAASGDTLTAAAIDMVGAGAVAQTVKTPALTATPTLLKISTGDRLGLDFTDDVAGELAGVTVTFYLVIL